MYVHQWNILRALGEKEHLFVYLPFRSFTQYWAFLTALEKKNRKNKDNKSDRNGAYEGKVIKVSINVWNCIFKSSQRIGQCYIPSEFVPFWNCPWVEGIFCSNPLWLLAVCKSTLWNKLSKNGQLIVDWHLCERLVCVAFYRRGWVWAQPWVVVVKWHHRSNGLLWHVPRVKFEMCSWSARLQTRFSDLKR